MCANSQVMGRGVIEKIIRKYIGVTGGHPDVAVRQGNLGDGG